MQKVSPKTQTRQRLLVGRRARQGPGVVSSQRRIRHAQPAKHAGPGRGGLAGEVVQAAGQVDQAALAADHGQAVEQAAHAHERRLFARVQGQHVKTVGRDVVRGRGKGQQPEHGQAHLQELGARQGQRHRGQRSAERKLQGHDPAAFAPEQIHQRAPQRFDHPGQVQPTGEQRDVGIAHAQVLVHHHAERHHHHIRQALAEVQRGHPAPRCGGVRGGKWAGRWGLIHG